MEKRIETLAGDSVGTEYRLTVLDFKGTATDAPKAYLQAALHANELPGVAALHYLIPMLEKAEREGRLSGDVRIVPHANPIGAGEYLFGDHMGRFALGSRINFNRDFPMPDAQGRTVRHAADAPVLAEKRLKTLLLDLAAGADIVLDLHCDDEAVSYLYVPKELWPGMTDLAACLGCEGVIAWGDSSDGAFEEAAMRQIGDPADPAFDWSGKAVSTVEFRGRADVSPALGEADAKGLYRFLVGRGVIRDAAVGALPAYAGVAEPIEHVEVLRAPKPGALLYHVRPGERVTAGAPLVTILQAPGEADGHIVVAAPQDGFVLTRRVHRVTQVGDDLLKLVGSRRSATAKSGTLDD